MLNMRTEPLRMALIFPWAIVIAVLIVMAGVSFTSQSWNGIDWDESAYAYVGKGILVGEVPYLDRWESKGPVTYLIYALGLIAPGWWGVWLINMAFLLSSTWLVFKMVQREFGTMAALFSISTFLIYASLLGHGGGLTENYALLFQLLALILFLRTYRRGGPNAWECIVLGVLGALSFLIRANLIGVWLTIGIYWIFRWRESRTMIAWSVAGGLSVLAATSLLLASLGAWGEFWDATIGYNLAHSAATVAGRIRAAMLLVWFLSPVLPLLGVGWCVGIWYYLTGKMQGQTFDRIWPFALTLGPVEVTLTLLSGNGFDHYFLVLLPVGTLYLGFLVWLVSKERHAAPAFLTFMLLFVTVNYHMDVYDKAFDIVRMVRNADEQPTLTRRERDLRVAETVKQNSSAEDTILVWGRDRRFTCSLGATHPHGSSIRMP